MKEDNYFWKYKYEPGKIAQNKKIETNKIQPLVSIITSYYNSNKDMWQTINCVLNQTFQSWEWIIVDDGSTDETSIKYLDEVKKIDSRIKIYYKENEGLAKGRDYAIKYSTTKYILPLDADDLIEPTYIETLYWTLETNKEATWAFTNSVGFGRYRYLSDCIFDSERMKTDNHITATSLIRKEKIIELGGYGQAKRYVNEDWHLWLRMLANNNFPVQVGFYGFWYRRQEKSLLTKINDENNEENKLRIRDLKVEADKITQIIKPIKYPKAKEENKLEKADFKIFDGIEILNKNEKSKLYILSYLGTDAKMYKKIKKSSKNYNIYIITLQNSKHSSYLYRQKYEQFATVYDLTTFLDSTYWINFIEYVKNTRNIDEIFLSDTKYNEYLMKYFKTTKIEKCKNNNIVYKYKILQYKITNSLLIRGIRKIARSINRKGDKK